MTQNAATMAQQKIQPLRGACLATPPACTLFMTAKCNLKCAWCRRAKIEKPSTPPMSLDVVKALLAQYPDISVFAMAGQGEPTIAPEFEIITRYLVDNGKAIILDTNGVNGQAVKGLRGYLARISLSLYGHDRESFEKYTGVDAFDKVMESFSIFKQVSPQVCISYIVDRDNMQDLEKVIALCDNLQPSRLLLYNPLCYDDTDKAQLAKIITAQDVDLQERITSLTLDKKYAVDLPPYPDFTKPINSCRSYCAIINIDGNGDVGACLRKVVPSAEYGNVFKDADCFNTEIMLRLRRRQMVGYPPHDACKSCFGNWGYGDYTSLQWKKEMESC